MFSLILVGGVGYAFGEAVVLIPTGASESACALTNECFTPNTVKIEPGDYVLWINADHVSHTIKDNIDDEDDFYTILSASRLQLTFDKEGIFSYYDIQYPWMTGKVIVGDAENSIDSQTVNSKSNKLNFIQKDRDEQDFKKMQERNSFLEKEINKLRILLDESRNKEKDLQFQLIKMQDSIDYLTQKLANTKAIVMEQVRVMIENFQLMKN